MNRPIRKVTVVCVVLFAALLINANWVQVGQQRSLKQQPTNSREIAARLDRERGAIVTDPTRTTLASSTPVDDEFKYLRQYADGRLYAPVTGYFTLYSATGLERSQNPFLNGDDDRLLASKVTGLFSNDDRRGGTVAITIDPRVQQAAAEALGTRKGAVVALDPRTGAILAMMSTPSYDPNDLAGHDLETVQKNYSTLEADPAKPLLNRAIQETYPPGSTFKIITAAAALSSGDWDPNSEIPAPDKLPLPQSTVELPNFGGERCGNGRTDTLIHALTISCNTAFAQLGMDLGDDKLRDQAEAFGFGSTIDDFELPQATSRFPGDLDQAQTAQSAIGQYDVRVTPLQMAQVVAAIANGGRMMKPYLVQELSGPDLKRIAYTEPEELGQPISAQVASDLTTMMESVVRSGTGRKAQINGVSVAGKTGTAEHGANEPPHAWFVGFAPADNPTIAIAVVVEDGGGESGTGGSIAAPIAQRVMQTALDVRG
ncbi:penicillin-binding protein 2 [Frankia sp. CNm7]|uniref:Penicillin-binding protein 2 n=1 Tax=Frankia nepalensis TaxID=1836974 RepID=A0A937RD18_9ACTN|nr:penicillin-binding protein 2 [Frankia nepalensis]MBL7494894.1 penicillin-binding protein 2 [Frankia nepalensis]MBL7515645.1 penicillin-binding protein 2 [Frankia nepalensis]MBL7521185.1 penicillin-binding protein 2 [Frankia nepalensis]MBL7626659.1 penicillin-binding protein 2 [Frankia nepalensis]